MRDILVTLIVLGSLPFILRRPIFGAIMWVWISVMNPHTQGWGFARSMPFAAIIAGTFIISVLASKEKFPLPKTGVVAAFILFALWPSVTALFAINPDKIGTLWSRWNKIALMTLFVLVVLRSRKEINWLVWTIFISLGYYGVKGGIFTLATGGHYRVWGPIGTFIDGNNEMALALVTLIPLIYYLFMVAEKKWLKVGLAVAMFLSAVAALGSYSRGALLAIVAMTGFLWLKSPHKGRLAMLLVLAAPFLFAMMPEQWHNRMESIGTYQSDSSAMGRINAWWMAFNLANDRPIFGGGFDVYDRHVFGMYAPNPTDVHAAHSIYFQVLGEHGWVGLAFYLALGILTWRSASLVTRLTKEDPELRWAHQLVTMLKVSLVGFAVGGAFLSLAYFDVPYFIMAIIVATRVLVERTLEDRRVARATEPEAGPASTGAVALGQSNGTS